MSTLFIHNNASVLKTCRTMHFRISAFSPTHLQADTWYYKENIFLFFCLQFHFVGAVRLGCHVSYTPRYWISVFACDTNLLCFSIVVIRQRCLVGQGFSTVIVLTSRFPWQNWKCIIYRIQFILSLIRSLNFVFGRTLCTSYLCFVIPIFSYNINWQAADIAYT